jgi:cell division protein FtsN
MKPTAFKPKRQRGNLMMGLIIGLLVGLGLSMAVALYISKVPVPFVNKVPQRTPDQDAAEIERNKNWDPNSGLYGKNPAPPSAPSSSIGSVLIQESAPGPSSTGKSGKDKNKTKDKVKDPLPPANLLLDIPAGAPVTSAANPPSAKPGSDALMTYFVQTGAYTNTDDAEQQRAQLAMMGYKAKVTEREQNGRTVYRVRLGPFDKRDAANVTKDKLDDAGLDAALVQVQK